MDEKINETFKREQMTRFDIHLIIQPRSSTSVGCSSWIHQSEPFQVNILKTTHILLTLQTGRFLSFFIEANRETNFQLNEPSLNDKPTKKWFPFEIHSFHCFILQRTRSFQKQIPSSIQLRAKNCDFFLCYWTSHNGINEQFCDCKLNRECE